ncbi:dihydrofolate reductase [Rhodoferax sp.]|uniref:dihydrofolate reductase n=1 Tax=Rhodoferax sp. TaxID=50421 RepID=UPI0025DB9053|nr:dihydrofolate reductase [Rhodoferax sp.]
MKLNLIYARARNGVIGNNNALPWHLPEDMAHFKRSTLGCPVIMGRKTWDSLPPKFRPLPGRLNVVVTRQTDWTADGAVVASSLPAACAACPPDSTAWIIGGAELYAHALALASTAVVTEIDADFAGDAFAPPLGPEWREVARESHLGSSGLAFSFVTYQKE